MDTANWMGELDPILQRKPLKDIVLPGSHDAGTWDLREKIGDAFAKCQRVNIKKQLEAGSRYLDLRAEKRNGTWYMAHGPALANTTLDEVLTDISDFLDAHPSEIVLATLLGPKLDPDGEDLAPVKRHLLRSETVNNSRSLIHECTIGRLRYWKRRLLLLDFDGLHRNLATYTKSEIKYPPGMNPPEAIPRGGVVMNRGGIWYDKVVWTPGDAEAYFKSEYACKIAPDEKKRRMWIYHLNVPFTTSVFGHKPWWMALGLIPVFTGPAAALAGGAKLIDLVVGLDDKSKHVKEFYSDTLTRLNKDYPLNIINIDFVDDYGWAEFIINLNQPELTS